MFHFRLAMVSAMLEEVTDFFSCAVCLEQFKEPKVLQCLHAYCKGCLVKLVKKKGSDHVIPCPVCREDTRVSKLFLKVIQLNLSTSALFYIACKQALMGCGTSNKAASVLVFLLVLCCSCRSTWEPNLQATFGST